MAGHDVLVLGAGPAGLAAAAALAARGLRVGLVAPDLTDAPPAWPATYCAWEDELAEVGFADVVDQRWPTAVASFGEGRRHALPRPYVRVDKRALAARLSDRAAFTRIAATVTGATHVATGTTLAFADGTDATAALVVDASGHRPVLVRPAASPVPAVQTAVGRFLAPGETPWRADECVLMDFDPAPLGADDGPPTFLYVLPLADGRFFVEETVLAARPPLSADILRARLDRRLTALGVSPAPAHPGHADEWVAIPMGGALPQDARVLAFGAAGGMIHPASGYLLPRVLGAAERLADAVAGSLGAGSAPEAAVAAGWGAVWPRDLRQRRALYRFGLEGLLAMNPATTRNFFHAFFQLPAADWAGYLSDRHTTPELRRVMWQLFAGVPAGLKWSLARAGFGPEGLALFASTVGR